MKFWKHYLIALILLIMSLSILLLIPVKAEITIDNDNNSLYIQDVNVVGMAKGDRKHYVLNKYQKADQSVKHRRSFFNIMPVDSYSDYKISVSGSLPKRKVKLLNKLATEYNQLISSNKSGTVFVPISESSFIGYLSPLWFFGLFGSIYIVITTFKKKKASRHR